MSGLILGALVEITGLPGKAEPVAEAAGAEARDLNGQKAQLVRYERDADKWIAATFDGQIVSVDPKYTRLLEVEDVAGYDFVFGPKSDPDTVGAELADVLSAKGYAVMKLFISEEDAKETLGAAHRLEQEGQFSRLAVEFERGYLGKEGSAKTLLVDPAGDESPDFVRDSPLRTMDQNFGAITEMLSPYFEESLGFHVYSRTALLLRMPLEDEDEDRYAPGDIDDGDAEGYLHTMVRKKLTLLQFVGPAGGTLTLTPLGGGEDIELKAEPHTLVLIVSNRFEYTYDPAGRSLALTSFLLSEPASYTLEEIVGDSRMLSSIGEGPIAPTQPAEHISVAGMYCRYGTNAEGRQQMWSGVGKFATDGVTEIPLSRWDHGPYFDPDGIRGAYTRHGCFGIEGVEMFDCRFFEISPGEAKAMDPCQRQVMEVSYMALLEGGWDKRSLQKTPTNIGHWVGIDKDDWMCMAASGMDLGMSGGTGAAAAANSITSNRFSYSLNLKGASMTIDTACSSSLVATHVAKLHLRYKDNEPMVAAVVNGLNLMLYPGPFVGCSQAGMLSHAGRCFTFNSTADGYARGELCGALCYKLLQFSPEEGSLCLLAGTFTNQDGRSASLTAPNGPAQEKCIHAVLKELRLLPSQVDCFECHGTGTSLGDPIEVGSFKKVMAAVTRYAPLLITSSKSNIAHGEGGAGLAGFFKVCLQLMHCEAASNLHLRAKNPHLDLEGFPCQVLSEVTALKDDTAYCGVSSFGYGGSNAHAEGWGRNIMTSRGSYSQDPNAIFQRKLRAAPPAEITMNGDDVMEWDTTGLDPRGEPGSKWTVELDEDGTAIWERADEDVEYGDEFYIKGTFSSWNVRPMERHESIPGCWVAKVTISNQGEEEFQIVADGERGKVYGPAETRQTMKAAPIIGPKALGQDKAWLLVGRPGEVYRVEFFQQDRHLSVMWFKQ